MRTHSSPPEADPTSIGSVLVSMGAVTASDLEAAVERQRQASIEHLLGTLLVGDGVCTPRDVQAALEAQAALRSRSLAKQAMGAVDIARRRKRATSKDRKRLAQKAQAVTRTATGMEHPIVPRRAGGPRSSGQAPGR